MPRGKAAAVMFLQRAPVVVVTYGYKCSKREQGSMMDEGSRRLALQIATQLPDTRDDALRVLGYVREMVDFVFREPKPPVEGPSEPQGASVVRLGRRGTG